MRPPLLLLLIASFGAFGQVRSTGNASTEGSCNVANTGNGSTVTVTCSNVDKKLADQIDLLVTASNRDGRSLKEISDKVDKLLKQFGPTIRQHSEGPNSPNINGNNNTVNIGPQLSGLIVPRKTALEQLSQDFVGVNNPLVVDCGGNLAASTRGSFVVLIYGGERILTVNRREVGIMLNGRVFSGDGKIVADIENNLFTVNPNNYFKIRRPDASTFSVLNQQGEEALSVDFVAPNYLVVTGTFHHEGLHPLIITRDATWYSGGITRGNLFLNDGAGLFTFAQ